jgi:hypothetical protein
LPRLIESHYEHIYGGCVAKLNAIIDELATVDPASTPPSVIARLKRDELTALNSTLLHELYFASLGGDGRAVPEGWPPRSRATSAASRAGGRSSLRSARRSLAAPDGCS